MLIEKGAQLDLSSEKNISPLHLGAFKGHFECVQLLLETGVVVDSKDESDMVREQG